MAKGNNRGQRPAGSSGTLPQAPPPRDTNRENPKFCLAHLVKGYDLDPLTVDQRAAFAVTLRKLARFTWGELVTADRKGCGYEFIPARQIRAPIPPRFDGEDRFMIFRYSGKHPMGGIRALDVYHVLWIERQQGELYDHGS